MAGESYTLTYRGPQPFVSMLAQMLKSEGVAVEWERATDKEERGAGEIAEGVVTSLLTTGSLLAIKTAVEHFRVRVKGRARVKIEGEPDDGGFF